MSLFWSILLTTFVVEDWAIAGSLVLINQGQLTWTSAYLACFIGICAGDILLYALGRAANASPKLRRWSFLQSVRSFVEEPQHQKALGWAIVLARAVPGTRFVTYAGAGLGRYSLWRFLLLTPISVGAWVLIAFTGGQALLARMSDHGLLAFILLLGVFLAVRFLLPFVVDPWRRRSLLHTWRRWFIFEFWPAGLAYAPIVPYYLYLSLKNGSFFHPFYANPALENSGLIGEAKTDILKYLSSEDAATLKTVLISAGTRFDTIKEKVISAAIELPVVAKPNIGQRGFAVRIIRTWGDLEAYARKAGFDFLIQEKSQYAREAGIFYLRQPGEARGEICSLTDKDFPWVLGDGRSPLGALILKDRRARIIAPQYFARHHSKLNNVIPAGETFYLSECGNHSQGAIFIDGQHLRSESLTQRIDEVAHRIPHFHFGRFDVRYRDHESLMAGQHFEIVEINGAGADITHIYDIRTPVREAYRVMFGQWRSLFAIGKAARRRHGAKAKVNRWAFFKECVRVNLRRSDLSISD